MKYIWNSELLAPDGRYVNSGALYAFDLVEVIEQVRAGVSAEWGSAPIYTGERLTLTINIENVPTRT